MASANHAFAVLVSFVLVVSAAADSPPFQTTKISLKGPTPNQKGFTTWAAKDTIVQQFYRHGQPHPLPAPCPRGSCLELLVLQPRVV